ncbi:eukaryotic translation initiation factor 3 subunit J-like [Telopea speciosissima]|uniref:eukaryotic translation initiation factor 3 subunit J-like n=1 Tax=Telopea speciosissima TaxID=54955 RepID=UPI001CC785C9|nr:eukaryotic translation initiation factor 3 subunit J-like [Telopea speciosissima]
MEDWEDEAVPPILKKEQPRNMWDDEDVDENDVKDSWEDEDEPTPAPAPEPPAEKVSKEPATKASDKKGKAAKVSKQAPASVPLDPVAEKLQQQRLVEEADYKSTTELFAKRGDEKTLDNFIPKIESDFIEYAELISQKIRPCEKSFHYISLLRAVIRLSLTTLKAADAKEVASSVSAIANEKLKAEKEANAGKKKTGAKKKQLHVGRPDDDVVVNSYDALDDYDFM